MENQKIDTQKIDTHPRPSLPAPSRVLPLDLPLSPDYPSVLLEESFVGFLMGLIDGCRLAQLMIDYDIEVATARTFTIKKVDADCFQEDEL